MVSFLICTLCKRLFRFNPQDDLRIIRITKICFFFRPRRRKMSHVRQPCNDMTKKMTTMTIRIVAASLLKMDNDDGICRNATTSGQTTPGSWPILVSLLVSAGAGAAMTIASSSDAGSSSSHSFFKYAFSMMIPPVVSREQRGTTTSTPSTSTMTNSGNSSNVTLNRVI